MRGENRFGVLDHLTVDQGISDIVGCLTDPIIVMPGGWGDTLPDWIKTAITLERLIVNMESLKGKEPTATDAEACAYLYTASLTNPMGSDWTQIYLYIATKVYEKWHQPNEVDYLLNRIKDLLQ